MLLLDEIRRVPLTELDNHMQRFRQKMDELNPGWKMVAINHKVAMYYFTGTIQDGVLIIRPEMVGRENTYVITENGSTALTCQNPEERMDLQIII